MKPIWLLATLTMLLALGGCTSSGGLPASTNIPLTMQVNGRTLTLPPMMTGAIEFRGTGRGGEDVREYSTANIFNFRQDGDQVVASYRPSGGTKRYINGIRQPRYKGKKCLPAVKTLIGSFNSTGQLVFDDNRCGRARITLTPMAGNDWHLHILLYGNGEITGDLQPA